MPSEYSVHQGATHPLVSSVNYLLGDIFSILHLYSTQLPSGRSDVSLRVQAFLSIHCAKAIAAKPVSAEQQAEITPRYY